MILLVPFLSTAQRTVILQKSEKNDISSLTDPPVGVEFAQDPFPIPRRTISFAVYSNDGSLQSVNINVSYFINGRVLYEKEGIIPVRVGQPYQMSLKLWNYGIGKGKISVRLWKHNATHDFDWTFPRKTQGFLFFVSIL